MEYEEENENKANVAISEKENNEIKKSEDLKEVREIKQNKIKKLKKKFVFKSLFTRLFVMYLGVLIISFAMIAAGLSTALESYFMKQKEEQMVKQGQKLAEEYVIAYYTGARNISALKIQIEAMEDILNARIWVVNKDGIVHIDSSDSTDYVQNIIVEKDIAYLLQGNVIKIENKFNDIFSESTLTIGYPVVIEEQVVGALLIHAPIPEIKQSISGVYRVFLLCLLVSLLIAFVLVYFTSKGITKPLKDINAAAKIISGGDFDKRIEIVSEDEIGQLAKSFNEMAEGLNKLEEYRSKFIANISHDLRSPITSIQGFLNAILDGTIPPEKQQRYLHVVLDETNRLTKLTNDILELTKIENPEIELKPENFDINEMIRNIMASFETRIIEKKLKMNVIFASGNSWVYADAQKIQRVIYNLIDNAVKFTGEGKSINIETTHLEDKINLSFTDTGIGMTEDEVKHIFERFYKADSSRGQDKKGSGLGLSIVKEIIKAHNENITVKSEIGVGTTFTITLMVSQEID